MGFASLVLYPKENFRLHHGVETRNSVEINSFEDRARYPWTDMFEPEGHSLGRDDAYGEYYCLASGVTEKYLRVLRVRMYGSL